MGTSAEIERLTPSARPEDVAIYHDFVDSSPQGILYCKTWWLEATAPGRWEVLLLKNGEAIRAAWPLVYGRSQQHITMPPLTQKLGVLFAPSSAKYARRLSDEIRVVQTFLQVLPARVRLGQHFHEAFTNWLPFCWEGFQQTTRYTYVFPDLSDVEALRSGMTDRCKRMLKKAEKAGVEAVESDDLEKVISINRRTFKRQGMDFPFSFDLIERLDRACQQHAGRRMLLAQDPQGQIHSCDYMVYDDRCAISLLQGADPKYRDSGAQRLLDWNSIQFAAKVSKKFDFEGSMVPGIEVYNREFGALQLPYFHILGMRKSRPSKQFGVKLRRIASAVLKRLALEIEP